MYLIFTVLCSSCVLLCLGDDGGFATTNYEYKRAGPNRWQLNNEDSTEINIKRNNIADTTHFPDTLESPDERGEDTESSEFNSDALKSFLETYAQKFKRPANSNERFSDEKEIESASSELPKLDASTSFEKADKSKSWDLMSIRKSSNPFDHKTGWVSLEAVPWSVSKVSKWEGKPDIKPHPNEQEIPKIPIHHQMYPKPDYQQEDSHFARPEAYYKPKPSYNTYKPHYNDFPPDPNEQEEHYYRPPTRPSYSQPPFQKHPQNSFSQHLETESEYDQRPPVRRYTTQKPFKNRYENYQNGGSDHYGDLITDGNPPNFPSYNDYYNRRLTASLDDHPQTHPENGNVLPPLEDSNINMTTSHGGLLQVESTFQSVEEAQKQHAQKEKLKRRKATTALPPTSKKPWRVWRKKFQPTATTDGLGFINSNEQAETVTNFPKAAAIAANPAGHDSAAVLAAVGAGMIPATMAMLVPMAMGGRRRRRRSTRNLLHTFPLFNQ